MATNELKQIWNNVDGVAVVVAIVAVVTIAVTILEQRHRKFHARYLKYCNLQFPNLDDMRPKLPFTLIFDYKRST